MNPIHFELTLLREAGYGLNFSEANTEKEIKNNPRARSAKLRIAEKV